VSAPVTKDLYEQARAPGVVIPRPDRGLLRLTGPQRIWFLENTVTNQIEGTAEGRWVETCFLDLKGKVLAHFRVGVLPEHGWLDVDPPGTADLVDWFVRYRFRTKVEIEDLSPGCFTVVGPAASELAADGEVRQTDGAVVFGGRLGALAIADVHAPELPEGAASLPRAGEELWDVLRLEHGIGRFGVDYGPTTLPQEAGLVPVVSVTKGCYVGQEVMARLWGQGECVRLVEQTLR
jgi:tRNA-modifying protein YgfZ